MPICEADPWRMQYFSDAACPPDVRIPTEDSDGWTWYPAQNWVYDKLRIAQSQGLACGPHGIAPLTYPVFSKPIFNLKGMGVGSCVLRSEADYLKYYTPGHFWMHLLEGEHVSTDCAVVEGRAVWWRHTTGMQLGEGMFDYWTIHAEARPDLEEYAGAWIAKGLGNYTGMVNLETIGGRIIEGHLRFADQWPDLYGKGWVDALVALYAGKGWAFADRDRRDGYSVVLFGKHGPHYRHPPESLVARVRSMPGVRSVQITFHENREPEDHAAPPGGFRLAIINTDNLEAGLAARGELAAAFPSDAILSPQERYLSPVS
ncbi:hypothetical protein BH10PSE7_BH10PSE7_44080 [soil metagenome]